MKTKKKIVEVFQIHFLAKLFSILVYTYTEIANLFSLQMYKTQMTN